MNEKTTIMFRRKDSNEAVKLEAAGDYESGMRVLETVERHFPRTAPSAEEAKRFEEIVRERDRVAALPEAPTSAEKELKFARSKVPGSWTKKDVEEMLEREREENR